MLFNTPSRLNVLAAFDELRALLLDMEASYIDVSWSARTTKD